MPSAQRSAQDWRRRQGARARSTPIPRHKSDRVGGPVGDLRPPVAVPMALTPKIENFYQSVTPNRNSQYATKIRIRYTDCPTPRSNEMGTKEKIFITGLVISTICAFWLYAAIITGFIK